MYELTLGIWCILIAHYIGGYEYHAETQNEAYIFWVFATLVMAAFIALAAYLINDWWVDITLKLLDAHVVALGVEQ